MPCSLTHRRGERVAGVGGTRVTSAAPSLAAEDRGALARRRGADGSSYMWRTTAVHQWEMTGSMLRTPRPCCRSKSTSTMCRAPTTERGRWCTGSTARGWFGGDLGPQELVKRIAANPDRIAPSEFATFQKLGVDGPLALGNDYVVRCRPWTGRCAWSPPGPTVPLRHAKRSSRGRADRVPRAQRPWRRWVHDRVLGAERRPVLRHSVHASAARQGSTKLTRGFRRSERVVKLAGARMTGGIVITTRRVEAAGRCGDGSAHEADGRGAGWPSSRIAT